MMSDLIKKRPIVIGIAGGSGSGKTTFAKLLSERFETKKVAVISTDSFFVKPLPQIISPRSGKIYDDWNAPASIDLKKLLQAISMHCSNSAGYDVVIVEGLSVLYFQELLEVIDLKIFIELDSDERMYRRIQRNMEMWNILMEEVAEYYLDAAKYAEEKNFLSTKRKADIIFNGNSDFSRAISFIESWLNNKLS